MNGNGPYLFVDAEQEQRSITETIRGLSEGKVRGPGEDLHEPTRELMTLAGGAVGPNEQIGRDIDLREELLKSYPTVDHAERLWPIKHQKQTMACTAYAVGGAAEYALRRHMALPIDESVSIRFIFQVGKENHRNAELKLSFNGTLDDSSYLDRRQVHHFAALWITEKLGVLPGRYLNMHEIRSCIEDPAMIQKAMIAPGKLQFRYYQRPRVADDERVLDMIRKCLHRIGPVICHSAVWKGFMEPANGVITDSRSPDLPNAGHYYLITGIQKDHFIVRNSFGTAWGSGGYALAPMALMMEKIHQFYAVEYVSN